MDGSAAEPRGARAEGGNLTDQLDILSVPRPNPARATIGRFHRGAGETEVKSAVRDLPRRGTQRARVLEVLQETAGGATDYELWHDYGIGARPHVPGTRREELIADGWPIKDSGKRRTTDTGSPAIVWVYVADAGAAAA